MKMKMKLQTKIFLWITAILMMSGIVTMFLSVQMMFKNTDESLARNLFNIAETVAKLPVVIEELKYPPHEGEIQKQALNIVDSSTDVDYVVVCNMDSIRYSHPNSQLIGEKFVGGDDKGIVTSPQRYISTGIGTLGVSMRALVPVFNAGNEQIGFVCVGTLRSSIQNAQQQLALSYIIYLCSGFFTGIVAVIYLTGSIKESLLGLEPEELAKLYRENKGMMEALHEGVIAIDKDYKITLSNETARNLIGMESDFLGMDIRDIMPNSRLPYVVETRQAEYDREQNVGGKVIITNRVPIIEKGKVEGAVATFQDKTLLIQLVEELTGAKHLVEALRASSHEFMNKLHTILGLIELERYEEAKVFIQDIHKNQQELNKKLFHTFKDPIISGLMLGKFSVCKEQGIVIELSPQSHLEAIIDGEMSHTLVTIIGNLIDNAMESINKNKDHEGNILVNIVQEENEILIDVRDNGIGIEKENMDLIFNRGFSTKGEGRGVGLYLIKQELDRFEGSILVESQSDVTTFKVSIPY